MECGPQEEQAWKQGNQVVSQDRNGHQTSNKLSYGGHTENVKKQTNSVYMLKTEQDFPKLLEEYF